MYFFNRGKLHIVTKNSNFEKTESALCMKSVTMPLSTQASAEFMKLV